MMKYVFLIFFAFLFIGCRQQKEPQQTVDYIDPYGVVIVDKYCKDVEKDILTPEEIAHWDSANAEGGFQLIRNADRNLDTIVNHLHMVFITEP